MKGRKQGHLLPPFSFGEGRIFLAGLLFEFGGRLNFYRRRSVGVERLDGLQPPCLPLLALLFAPADRLPIRREDQTGARIHDLDAVAAGLINVEEKALLDGMLVRTGFDVDALFQKNVGGAQNVLAGIHRIREMVESPRVSV